MSEPEGGNPAFCSACGAALKEEASFCSKCGAAVSGECSKSDSQQIPYQQTLQTPYINEKSKNGRNYLPVVLICCGLILIIAAFLVWVFAFRDGKGGVGTPEDLVFRALKAFSEKDVETLFDCYDPDYLMSDFGEETIFGKEMGQEDIAEAMMNLVDFKYSDIKLKTEHTGSDEAEVYYVSGKMSIKVFGINMDIDVEDSAEFAIECIKRDGRWYLTSEFLPIYDDDFFDIGDFGFDGLNFDDFKFDFDFDGLDFDFDGLDFNFDDFEIDLDLNIEDILENLEDMYKDFETPQSGEQVI